MLHPEHPELDAHVSSIHGFRLEEFPAQAIARPSLPAYVPQLLMRSAYRGYLDSGAYAFRPDAIGQRTKTASRIRGFLGLRPDQLVIALLFDTDERLERLYDPARLAELAAAKYDLVVAPSYSIWWGRPRLHHLYNLTRSLAVCIALQRLGAAAVPRVDWVIEPDIERWARWIDANPVVDFVALDAMTSKSNGWDQLVDGLERFDGLTGNRLSYLINGPSVPARWNQLYALIGAERVTLTDANLAVSPPTHEEQLVFPGKPERSRGPRLRRRITRREAALAAAREHSLRG